MPTSPEQSRVVRLGRDGFGRLVQLVFALRLNDVVATLPSSTFVLMVAMDASDEDARVLSAFARSALARGATYVVAWGPDCERVHDIFDEVIVAEGLEMDNEDAILTTWHAGESLREAVEFALLVTEGPKSADAVALVFLGESEAFDDAQAVVASVLAEGAA